MADAQNIARTDYFNGRDRAPVEVFAFNRGFSEAAGREPRTGPTAEEWFDEVDEVNAAYLAGRTYGYVHFPLTPEEIALTLKTELDILKSGRSNFGDTERVIARAVKLAREGDV